MTRLPRLVLLTALALVASASADLAGARNLAHAAESPEIAVGTELVAVSDVTLHKAEIQKGSRVSVTKLLVSSGRLDGVNVALADGHVVKVPMSTVHSYFRVASP